MSKHIESQNEALGVWVYRRIDRISRKQKQSNAELLENEKRDDEINKIRCKIF